MVNRTMTEGCARCGHPEFMLEWSAVAALRADVEEFARTLEEQVASGERFAAGETYQLGWTMTRLVAAENGCLAFEEPDFHGMPIAWVRGIGHAIVDLRRQKDVVESFEPAMDVCFPHILQPARACAHLVDTRAVIVERDIPSKQHSGWYITCDAERDGHELGQLRWASLYQIALELPWITPYLAIPPGHAGRITTTGIEIYGAEDRPLPIRRGSLLDRLHRRTWNGD